MLFNALLVAAAAFSSFAAAQNDTTNFITPCCQVDPGSVPPATRQTWCNAERNTCPQICGGPGSIKPQTCDTNTLNFTCECSNGTKPDMSQYQQSVPGLMCRFWFDQCINLTGSDVEKQFYCTSTRDSECGNLTIDDSSSSSSASASSTSTASGSSDSGSSSATTTGASAAASTGAATALAIAREYGTPMLAGGLMAIFGLAL